MPTPTGGSGASSTATSDDGYLDLVGLDSNETLPSFAEAEGFFDRAYARIGVFDVQELRQRRIRRRPLLWPARNSSMNGRAIRLRTEPGRCGPPEPPSTAAGTTRTSA